MHVFVQHGATSQNGGDGGGLGDGGGGGGGGYGLPAGGYGGGDGGDGGGVGQYDPQSAQSVPHMHAEEALPSEPSSHTPFLTCSAWYTIWLAQLLHMAGRISAHESAQQLIELWLSQ